MGVAIARRRRSKLCTILASAGEQRRRKVRGIAMLARHRLVMAALADEMKGPIHALTLDVKTPDEIAETAR